MSISRGACEIGFLYELDAEAWPPQVPHSPDGAIAFAKAQADDEDK